MASAQLTDPCSHDDAPTLESLAIDIGDLDGDGVAEYATFDPNQSNAAVEVFSGIDDTHVFSLAGTPADRHFFAVTDAGDVNLDGTPDIAVGSIYSTTSENALRAVLFDGTNGQIIAYLYPFEYPDGSPGLLPVLAADCDATGVVGADDVNIVVEGVGATTVNPSADLNNDGVVTLEDLLLVLGDLGCTPTEGYDFSILVDAVLNAEYALDNPDFVTVFANLRGADDLIAAGPIGCLWCLFKCGKWLDKAWECRDSYWDAYCACYDLDDTLDQLACQLDVRQNFLRTCLDEIIDATDECAKCIRKCGPKGT